MADQPTSSLEGKIPESSISGSADLVASPYQFRASLGMHDPKKVGLDCLVEVADGEKPPYAYPVLIRFAILGSPKKRLTLRQIYETLEAKYSYFRDLSEAGWKVSRNKCPRKSLIADESNDATEFNQTQSFPQRVV
jgi:hypothetical protein